jgi:hypothetical protein
MSMAGSVAVLGDICRGGEARFVVNCWEIDVGGMGDRTPWAPTMSRGSENYVRGGVDFEKSRSNISASWRAAIGEVVP